MNLILDNMISEGLCKEMIVVANWGYAYKQIGHNQFTPVNAAEVISKECVPFIDKKYRTIADRRSRAAAGLSYGGGLSRQMVHDYPEIFANLGQLSSENAIIINEGDYMGRIFFRDLYSRLGLNVKELSFAEHDETMAYSLSIPFVSTFVFSAVMKHQDTPGTTFKRHMTIARGVLSEDDTLLREILFNPHTKPKVETIRAELKQLIQIIDDRDEDAMTTYLTRIRKNIKD